MPTHLACALALFQSRIPDCVAPSCSQYFFTSAAELQQAYAYAVPPGRSYLGSSPSDPRLFFVSKPLQRDMSPSLITSWMRSRVGARTAGLARAGPERLLLSVRVVCDDHTNLGLAGGGDCTGEGGNGSEFEIERK
ncbi:hypothetical protein DFH09DRAFT_1332878 [Mycena vulgaris]|nr:hypothetical protein DFH09DRAFT_1332878 [Mycena vulgaris]